MSQRVHGCALVPEFTPPGKPTGERIAVEYLLAQKNRGDLLPPKQMPEIPSQVLEEDKDEPDATVCMPGDLGAGDPWDEGEPDATLSQSAELGAGDPDPPSAVGDQVLLEGETEPGPLVTETSQCDSRGVVGWEAVDGLAAYLVGLNHTITASSAKEEADIVHLYTALHAMDKAPSRYKIVIILYTIIKQTFYGTNEAYGCLFHRLGTPRRLRRKDVHQEHRGENPGSRVALLLDSRRQRGA
ncbi:hypothetical protein ABVT39_022187 [Epinephelus coioides]